MKSFKFITHDNHDAYFNLASEEYLLKETDGYYVYLWINAPAVIVGVNQNTLQEVNLSYTESNGIKVVRRLTGGGAVYHDYGNLCYTVIAPYDESENNYKKFTAPVIEYLNELGVKAEFSGRNDITIGEKKISGNAQTVYKDRIMHHGTILFSSNMGELSSSLNPSKIKVESKGIKSVRARVTNVKEHLQSKMTIEEFKKGLEEKFLKTAEKYEFSKVKLFKAGHHGSPTSSNDCLLREIQPEICVICCCAGSVEYTDYLPKTFPSRAVINRLIEYQTKIYVPITVDIEIVGEKTYEGKLIPDYDNKGDYKLLNGNIKVTSSEQNGVTVNCSNNNTVLTKTDWYKSMCELWKNYD